MLVSYFKPFPSISLKVLLKTLFIDIYNPSIWCRYFVCCWSAEEIPFTAPHWQRRLSHPLTWKRLSTRLLKKKTPGKVVVVVRIVTTIFSKWWNWWNNSKRRIERERPVKDTPIPFPVNPRILQDSWKKHSAFRLYSIGRARNQAEGIGMNKNLYHSQTTDGNLKFSRTQSFQTQCLAFTNQLPHSPVQLNYQTFAVVPKEYFSKTSPTELFYGSENIKKEIPTMIHWSTHHCFTNLSSPKKQSFIGKMVVSLGWYPQ